ncbi:MAG: S41 family peptidase [Alphaproteobacteria bacterium]|nr:S41 family peptidase [Alphaproteobacteria bacterium]
MRKISKLCLVGGLLITTSLALAPVVSYAEKDDTYQLLNLFGDVFERVRSDYVEETKDSELVEAAINGMLTSLDPHSAYMNEKGFKEMQVQTKGEFGGLGIEVTMDNGLVKVVSPIDDTPAAKAGLKPGDYVSHIDDEQVMGLTLAEAVEKMRGKVDSQVKLTVLRENTNEPLEFTLTRAIIKIKSSKARAEGDDIIYLRISSFTENTTDLMRDEFAKAKKEVPDLRGVVLDLRNNPGGLLDQAISVSDAFLKQGEIVSTRERDPEKTRRYSAQAGDELIDDNVPVVVLVNSGSASASEIVSGALQDHKRAVILGTKTFGKGSVQTVIPIPEHGAIRLTTARYYTPSGRSIQAKGIEPNIVVEPAKIELLKADKMRSEADLRKRLENLEDKKNENKSKDDKAANSEKKKDTKIGNVDSAEDFQLQRALDVLRALNVYSQVQPEK